MSSEHKSGAERYLVTYADLLTLLLAFFIVMWATSKADLDKFSKIASALNQTLGGGKGMVEMGGSGSTGLSPGPNGGSIAAFPQISQRSRDYIFLSQQIDEFAQQIGVLPEIGVNMRKEGIVITLSNALLFPSGGAGLDEKSRTTLDKLADLLRVLPNDVRIEAHTDNVPTTDPVFSTNWELSTMRAVTVVRYLSEEGEIPPERLSAVGYGEYHPLFPNDSREHRSLNRRADIIILYPPEEPERVIDLLSLPVIVPVQEAELREHS